MTESTPETVKAKQLKNWEYHRTHTIVNEVEFINGLGCWRGLEARPPGYADRSYAWWLQKYIDVARLAADFYQDAWRVQAQDYARKKLERELKRGRKTDPEESGYFVIDI